MMGMELPAVSAVMARLPHPEIHLAAYGGIVFPLALLVEAPIIMLLSASTALSRDRISYRKLRGFMILGATTLTAVHLALVATPLYEWVTGTLLDAPHEIRGPARWGLWILLPWTASIAYRRFQQGVLIRFGHSGVVGTGTAIRLGANVATLTLGVLVGTWPGIVVGSAAVAAGVLAEAVFIGWMVRPVLRDELPDVDPKARPLTRASFARFYAPLAATSMMTLLAMPIGSAAMGRMPMTIESLAVWPVINGLVFTLRSLGFAYSEVVVALVDREGALAPLFRFALGLSGAVTAALLLLAATPLAGIWFGGVSALNPELSQLAQQAIWITVLFPAASVLLAFLTGILVNQHQTRGVSEAVSLHLLTITLVLAIVVPRTTSPGIFMTLTATFSALVIQILWLARRTLPILRKTSLAG